MESRQEAGFLGALTSWVEKTMAPGVVKFTENPYVSAIRAGFLATIPVMIIGSVFLIIWLFPIPAWEKIVAPFAPKLMVMVNYTFGILGLICSYTIAYNLAKNLDMEPVAPGIFSLVSFLILSPPVKDSIPLGFLGGTGLFSSIVLAIATVSVLRLLYRYRITIKMPKGVPPAITEVFTSIVPGLVYLAIVWLVRVVLNIDVNTIILNALKPLVVAGDSLIALNTEVFINRLAWFVGIHGYTVVQSIAMPFWTMALAENAKAAAAGLPIPHIGTSMFLDGLALWSGSVTWPVIGILLFSKLKSFRALGRLNAPIGFFMIWEPIMFGLPIILNPMMFIPFLLSGIWGVTFAWFMVRLGFVTAPYIMIPMITPPIIGGYLTTGGDWRAIPVTIIVLVGAAIIWYPFIKAWERIRAQENPSDIM